MFNNIKDKLKKALENGNENISNFSKKGFRTIVGTVLVFSLITGVVQKSQADNNFNNPINQELRQQVSNFDKISVEKIMSDSNIVIKKDDNTQIKTQILKKIDDFITSLKLYNNMAISYNKVTKELDDKTLLNNLMNDKLYEDLLNNIKLINRENDPKVLGELSNKWGLNNGQVERHNHYFIVSTIQTEKGSKNIDKFLSKENLKNALEYEKEMLVDVEKSPSDEYKSLKKPYENYPEIKQEKSISPQL